MDRNLATAIPGKYRYFEDVWKQLINKNVCLTFSNCNPFRFPATQILILAAQKSVKIRDIVPLILAGVTLL